MGLTMKRNHLMSVELMMTVLSMVFWENHNSSFGRDTALRVSEAREKRAMAALLQERLPQTLQERDVLMQAHKTKFLVVQRHICGGCASTALVLYVVHCQYVLNEDSHLVSPVMHNKRVVVVVRRRNILHVLISARFPSGRLSCFVTLPA